MKTHKCSFVFFDERVGEFEYLVIGETDPPEHYDAPAFKT